MIKGKFNKPSGLVETFTNSEQLPGDNENALSLQEANKSFWEKQSMRYDWLDPIRFEEFSSEFYKEIDNRFFSAVHTIMPWKSVPFEQWLDIPTLKTHDVLEIGVGNGTHAQLIAPRAKSYTGIDLTEYAAHSTRKRLELNGIKGNVLQMDAERLEFHAASFDFVWSWGVIHHSSNTDKILNEIHRVLRPGGKAVIMVYYRSWFSYYLGGALLGVAKGYIFKGKTIHQIIQSQTDGALARYYTLNSWRKLVSDRFQIRRLETLGNKSDILPMPASRIKTKILNAVPTLLTRLFLKNLRMGTFLICEMVRK